MIDPKKIEEIAKQIGAMIPSKVREVADDVENKVKQVLQQKLSQLEFVSREEFDVQTQVLAKTRIKLDELERRIAELSTRQNPSQ